MLKGVGFVAERQLNLARPFKAGIVRQASHVALATIERTFQPSPRDDVFDLSEIPALKGRAKFKPPLRGEHFL
jgi:hypothetical protein